MREVTQPELAQRFSAMGADTIVLKRVRAIARPRQNTTTIHSAISTIGVPSVTPREDEGVEHTRRELVLGATDGVDGALSTRGG